MLPTSWTILRSGPASGLRAFVEICLLQFECFEDIGITIWKIRKTDLLLHLLLLSLLLSTESHKQAVAWCRPNAALLLTQETEEVLGKFLGSQDLSLSNFLFVRLIWLLKKLEEAARSIFSG